MTNKELPTSPSDAVLEELLGPRSTWLKKTDFTPAERDLIWKECRVWRLDPRNNIALVPNDLLERIRAARKGPRKPKSKPPKPIK